MLKKLLIIDTGNNPDIERLLTDSNSGFIYERVDSCEEALITMSKSYRLIKLIIISVKMFRYGSFFLITQMKKQKQKNIPILCIGGCYNDAISEENDYVEALSHGAVNFFPGNASILAVHCYIRNLTDIEDKSPMEDELGRIDSMTSNLRNGDMGTFWNPNRAEEMLKRTYEGAACIIEQSNDRLKIVKANERFSREIFGHYAPVEKIISENLRRHVNEKNVEILINALDRASINGGRTETCDIRITNLRNDQQIMYFKVYLRLLRKIKDKKQIYCMIENNTDSYEAARRENELMNQLKMIIQNFNGGIVVAYTEFDVINLIYSNDEFYSLLGYTREQFREELSGDFNRLILPEYVKQVRAAIRSSVTQMKSTQMTFKIRKRDGSCIWIRSRNSFYYIISQKQLAYITFYEDITNIKRSEERIQALNEKLGDCEIFYQLNITRRIIEAHHSIYETDEDGTVSEEKNYMNLLQTYIYKDDQRRILRSASYDSLQKSFDEGNTKLVLEYRRNLPDDELRWFEATIILAEGIDKGVTNAYIYCHDIDTKEKTRIAKDRIMDNDVDDITIINIAKGTSRIVKIYENSIAACDVIYNHNEGVEEFVNKEVADEDKPRCREFFALENLVKAVPDTGFIEISFWITSKEGINRRKYVVISYLDSTHRDFLMIGRDITALFEKEKEQQMALQHAVELADFANQAKSDFLSRMSHDMRTPLTAILGITELAENETNIEVLKEYLKNIAGSGEYLLGLINDTLDLSKIESGKMELNREGFPLQEFINGVNTIIKPLMDAKHIDFVINLQDQTRNIMVDKLRFNQIFYNLLSNAAKYTPEGGHVEFASERIPMKNQKFGMRFFIRDNGIGMSREYQKILFDPFTQEFHPARTEQKGTGLGLAIVKKIVDLAEGSITVNSEPGKGTEFIVDLYAYSIEQIEYSRIVPENRFERLRDMHILLVDDTKINTMIVKKILEYYGAYVDIAENGLEGVRAFEKSKPGYYDVILTDVRMPVMDGFEEARNIRKLNRTDARTIPIIAATADAYEDIHEKILRAGMNERLVKPIKANVLCQTIIRLTEERI